MDARLSPNKIVSYYCTVPLTYKAFPYRSSNRAICPIGVSQSTVACHAVRKHVGSCVLSDRIMLRSLDFSQGLEKSIFA